MGPDYDAEILHLLDDQGDPICQIQYVRGLESHPNRGTDPGIQRALNLIRRMNTRRPPERVSSSDEAGQQADDEGPVHDDEGPCHGFSTSPETEQEDEEMDKEDLPEYNRILAIARGLAPPETPPRTKRRHQLIDLSRGIFSI